GVQRRRRVVGRGGVHQSGLQVASAARGGGAAWARPAAAAPPRPVVKANDVQMELSERLFTKLPSGYTLLLGHAELTRAARPFRVGTGRTAAVADDAVGT
ncbi:hypothetical protein ACFXJB_50730, partial [Streptomyces mirabilis]